VGFDRERAFDPTVLMVIASYYVLFAAMGSHHMAVSGRTLELEIAAATVFLLLTVVGFNRSSWLVVAALAGHGVLTSSIISSWRTLAYRTGGPASVWRWM
jgi:hypothetical protein